MAAAQALETDLATEKVTPEAARARLDELKKRHFAWFRTGKILEYMNAGYIAEGDAIMLRFRTGTVKEADWQAARGLF